MKKSKLLLLCLSFSVAGAYVAADTFADSKYPSDERKLAPLPLPRLPREHKPKPTTADITEQDLMTRLYIFADDSMLGREAGTIGNFKGTNYLAAEAKRIGLEPGGDSGTFFQIYPVYQRKGDPSSPMIEFPPRNVIAILPGSDPVLKHTYVALGSHNDHEGVTSKVVDHDSLRIYNYMARPGGLGSRVTPLSEAGWAELNSMLAEVRKTTPPKLDSVFNGADDDGSGSVAMLEIAEYLISLPANKRPKRSILFVWHTAEEKGLLGSKYFTDNLKNIERDSIITQINLDMIGRGHPWDQLDGGPDFLQLVGSRRLSTELGDLVETVNKEKKYKFELDYGLDANGHYMQIYCRSDHFSYARYGIPVVFFFTGVHPDYHQLTDEPQYINYPHLTKITKFISDLTLELANRAERPFVDKPKPDPWGRCRQ